MKSSMAIGYVNMDSVSNILEFVSKTESHCILTWPIQKTTSLRITSRKAKISARITMVADTRKS